MLGKNMTVPSFSCERSQHHEARSAWSDSAGPRKKKRRLLLSPLTSSSAREEIHYFRESGPRDIRKKSQSEPGSIGVAQDSAIESVKESRYQSHGRKRKRSWLEEESPQNRNQALNPGKTASTFLAVDQETANSCESEGKDICHPIKYWASTGRWPKNFSTMSLELSDSSKKRPRTPSYTQRFKDGDVPRAHSSASERVLAEHGVYMQELKGRSLVGNASRVLSEKLLQGKYDEPQYTLFPLSEFLSVWQRAQNRNEGRVYRDITHVLVPSAELLHICGHQDLEHIAEEISAEWTKGKTLGGPKPKPDFAAGIAQSAFTDEEVAKLKNHTAFERPTLFTEHMYFPFLLCEAKCGNEGINRADRQNMHSSSMAINAIIQLYRSLEGNKASQLNGQVLVFSISHDNERVKMYGHFAVIQGEQATFYRFFIASFVLNYEESQGRQRTYNFVREIYHKFYPEHLKRIQGALAKMNDPRAQLMPSSMSMEESESQELDPSAPPSPETAGFKKPNAPATKKQKGEMALLRDQMALLERQMAQQEKQYKEQMAQQEKQYKEQMAQQKEQMAQQEKQYKEQIEMLKQILDRR